LADSDICTRATDNAIQKQDRMTDTDHIGEPLQKYPVVRTSDPENFRNTLTTVYGATALCLPDRDGFEARGNFIQLQDIALGFSSCTVPATVDFPEGDFARQQVALAGMATATTGCVATEIHSHQSSITSPDQSAKINYGPGYRQLIVRVKKAALERKLTLILGAKPKGKIEFEAATDLNRPHSQSLWQLILFVARQLDSTSAKLPPMALRQLQQAITINFLYANRHTFSGLLEQEEKDAAPRHVRRVEDYIEAHWDQAITIEKLAEVTDLSARAIFKAFQQSRGYSPMAFAKKVRLTHANEMLKTPDTKTSVTGVAFACGFANLGHFARDYREMFRERPSETLGRAK
jgi:AraC-like DNA-binding protein